DDLLDRLVLERLHRKRHGDVRLARSRGAEGKHEIIGGNQLDQLMLVHGLRPDGRALGSIDNDIVLSCWRSGSLLLAGDVLLDIFFRDPPVLMVVRYQGIQYVIDLYDFRCRTLDQDLVASRNDLAFWKSCGKGIDGFIFYSKKLYE